jgi:ubiquinone/menaquinone biosynthesis C-methylase UbiE
VSHRSLVFSYTLLSPLYDAFVSPAIGAARRRSVESLRLSPSDRTLLVGLGTGLDLPLLPPGLAAYGFDLTPAMLRRARRRARGSPSLGRLFLADAHHLPFPDASFDVVLLHLILAIVPDPRQAFREAARVLSPGGRMAVLDKFLRGDERAGLVRSLADGLLRPFVTGLNTRLDDVLAAAPEMAIVSETPELLGRLFRRLVLEKRRGKTAARSSSAPG